MKNIIKLTQISLLFFVNFCLHGQKIDLSLNETDKKSIESYIVKSTTSTVSPVINTGVVSSLASINLISVFNDTRAEARVGFNVNRSTFNISLAQSFTSKPKNVTFFDADGLNTGTSLSLSWQTSIGGIKMPSVLPITNLKKFIEIKLAFRKDKAIKDSNDTSFEDFTPEYRKKIIDSGAINLDAFATPWLLALKLNVSKVNFDFVADSLSKKPSSDQKINKGFTVSLSKFKNLDTYFSFSYSFLINNRSGDDIIPYNFPVGNSGVTYTKEVTLGAPVETTDSKIKAELRKVKRNKDFVPFIGLNPSISYFFKKQKLNLDFPIYLLSKNDKDELNGLQLGFKVGYTSKIDSFLSDLFDFNTNKIYLGIFVSKPFLVRD